MVSVLSKSEPILSSELFNVQQDCSTYKCLKARWLKKIKNHRDRLSRLSPIILPNELIMEEKMSEQSLTIHTHLNEFQLKQKSSLHALFNLIVRPEEQVQHFSEAQQNLAPKLTKQGLLDYLNEKGYEPLADKLKHYTGDLWEYITQIRNPMMIEQILDIYAACHHQFPDEKQKIKREALIIFARDFAIISNVSAIHQDYKETLKVINEAKSILGQLLYLISNDPKSALKCISCHHSHQKLANIRKAFSEGMQNICTQLDHYYLAHLTTQLQPVEVALNVRIPFEIAKALLTCNGTINAGIIDLVWEIFLSHEEPFFNYEASLAYGLKILRCSPKIRADFECIKSPNSQRISSNEIVNVTLNLPLDHKANAHETTLVALTAFLSHLRQNEEGSCFATSVVLEVLSCYRSICFKDLKQILESGKLTRTIKDVQKDIPCVTKIRDKNLQKVIYFNNKGQVIIDQVRHGYLWSAPGIIAACIAIGYSDVKSTIKSFIKDFFANKHDFIKAICVEDFLRQLAERAPSLKFFKKKASMHVFHNACRAFSRETNDPLLKVWENTIACMAEIHEEGMIKKQIVEAIVSTIKYTFYQMKIAHTSFLDLYYSLLLKTLHNSICLYYDPVIYKQNKQGILIKKSGFVLHHLKQKIDNQEMFDKFLQNIINEMGFIFGNKINPIQKRELDSINKLLLLQMKNPMFMARLLVNFNSINEKIVNQNFENKNFDYEELDYTPWITQSGNNSKNVLKVYFELDKPLHTQKFTSKGAMEALTNIIEMCKQMNEAEKKLFVNNPNKLKPFCILGKHRLPFMAGHLSLAKAWLENCPTQEWIEMYVLEPGRKISETEIDNSIRDQLFDQINSKTFKSKFPAKNYKNFLNDINSLGYPLTIKRYRKNIVDLAKQYLPAYSLEQFAIEIDTMIYQSLNSILKRDLEVSAVHFADTNWCDDIHDIHFCFVINPGTGNLELWEAHSNGTHLVALDQNYWISNQSWEFWTIPEEQAIDDFSHLRNSHSQIY